jgi:hypothetical protein
MCGYATQANRKVQRKCISFMDGCLVPRSLFSLPLGSYAELLFECNVVRPIPTTLFAVPFFGIAYQSDLAIA